MNTIYEPYWFDYQDFYKFISTHNYKTFVELGVWLGHSVNFLAKHSDPDSIIYAIDLFDDSYTHKNYKHLDGLRYELFDKNGRIVMGTETINDFQKYKGILHFPVKDDEIEKDIDIMAQEILSI